MNIAVFPIPGTNIDGLVKAGQLIESDSPLDVQVSELGKAFKYFYFSAISKAAKCREKQPRFYFRGELLTTTDYERKYGQAPADLPETISHIVDYGDGTYDFFQSGLDTMLHV